MVVVYVVGVRNALLHVMAAAARRRWLVLVSGIFKFYGWRFLQRSTRGTFECSEEGVGLDHGPARLDLIIIIYTPP